MKIALLADLHLGFGYRRHSRDPRRLDSFENAAEALRIATERADVILIAGDIFDRPTADLEVFLRALDIFEIPRSRDSGVLVDGKQWKGVPVIAIRGNHDVSADLHRHPVLLLDRAHRLKYINAEQVTLEKDGEKVVVTGAGWVPDKDVSLVRRFFAEKVPKPVDGAYNILMLHQPLEGIGRYPGETPLPISDLPAGFDLYHSGHLHWHYQARVSDRWIVIPGSTVRTQLTDREVEDDRAFWILDTETNRLEEVFLPNARKGFLRVVNVDGKGRDEVVSAVVSVVESAIEKNTGKRPPIVKVVLQGSTYDVFDLSEVVNRYADRAVVRVFDQTTSAVAEKLAEVASEGIGGGEVFSPAFALEVLKRVMREHKLEIGEGFDQLYRRLADVGRLDRDKKEALIEEIGDTILNAVRPLDREADVSVPVQEKPANKPRTGSILDWANP